MLHSSVTMILDRIVSLQAAFLAAVLRQFPLVVLAGLAAYHVFRKRGSSIYLLDFKCYSPPASFRQPMATFQEHVFLDDRLDPESKAFLCKILEKSGFSDEIAVPPSSAITPIRRSLAFAFEEATCVIITMVQDLLLGNSINPRSIDILVCNSSMFSPTPSLTAMIVNKFKMRSNALSYNLSGMGCSAGIVSIALARDVLRVHSNSLALIVSTEVLNMNWYVGKNTSMLMTNCLFRMGGAALLMSSRDIDKRAAKYELEHLVRTNHACEDQSYTCVFQDVDSEKKTGVLISKDILNIAGEIRISRRLSHTSAYTPEAER